MKPTVGWCYPSVRIWPRATRLLVLGLSAPLASAQVAPVAAFTTNPNPAHGEELLLVQFLDHSTGEISAWSWDFGDGASSSEQNPLHQYIGFGNFDVTLTVGGPGGSDSFTLDSAVELLAEPPPALGTMPVPMPSRLGEFVADMPSAVRLGKALFWDVQLGSDGLTACASCHYHAGVDNRPRNTLHPGANGRFDPTQTGAGGPNALLTAGDFPFTKFLDPMDGTELLADSDDRRGATGVLKTSFSGIAAQGAADLGTDQDDGLFHVGGTDTLQATGRDAPTAIGAIFFHRIFWDGRANHFFNGRNIWGNADPSRPPVLELLADGGLGEISVLLDNAAAASQAVGPPLSDVEMSWGGRTWPDVGRKMLARRPLANQIVDPGDGVLGRLAHVPGPGLDLSLRYDDLVRAAFHPRWWGSSELTAEGFTHMEGNFALFFGLAIQCYEATLVPDQAPFDRFRSGDFGALTPQQQSGLAIFLGKGRCITCHDTPLFAGSLRDEVIHNSPEEAEGLVERMVIQNALSTASITFATQPQLGELPLTFNPFRRAVSLYSQEPRLLLATTTLPSGQRCAPAGVQQYELVPTAQVASTAKFQGSVRIESDGACNYRIVASFEWNEAGPSFYWYDLLIGGQRFELLIPPASRQAVYDNGFYNIGVRPSTEDPGVGGNGPFGPLSITRRAQRGEDVGQDTHGAPIGVNERVAVTGSFKTPTLRNVELTGPYMHNGGMATLEQVVEFYTRGTDFGDVNFRDKDIDVSGISDMTEEDKASLVAFLEALTDPRVRFEQAPFDHPELPLKAGHVGDNEVVASDAQGNGLFSIDIRPATGAEGGEAIPAFIERLAPSITVACAEETTTSARVALMCDKQPTADVRVRLRSDPSIAAVAPQEIVFHPSDWRVTRYVDVQRVAPGTDPAPFLLHTSYARSADPQFSNLVVADMQLDFVPESPATTPPPPPPTPALLPGGAPRGLR